MISSYLIVSGREGEVLFLLLHDGFELMDQISSNRCGWIGDCGEQGLAVPASNSGVPTERHPGGEYGLAVPDSNSGVSMTGHTSEDTSEDKELAVSVCAKGDSDSSENSFNGNIPKPRSAICSSQKYDVYGHFQVPEASVKLLPCRTGVVSVEL